MFSRVFSLLPLTALIAVAAAAPNALEARTSSSSCDVSNQSCCNTNQLVAGQSYTLGLLGLLSGLGLGLGVTCTPVTVLGLSSGAQCTQQAVCCDGNTSTSLVNLSCSPINVNA